VPRCQAADHHGQPGPPLRRQVGPGRRSRADRLGHLGRPSNRPARAGPSRSPPVLRRNRPPLQRFRGQGMHRPWPSCQRTLIKSPRRPRKTNRWPPCGSRRSVSCTSRAKPSKPLRMSVCPVASHTRTPVGTGIIGALPRFRALPRRWPDQRDPQSAPVRRPIRPRPRRRGSPRVGMASRREQAAPVGQRLARVGVRWTAPAAAVHAATGTKGSE
jgi:hypothetical protein